MALSPTRVAYRHLTRQAAAPDLHDVMDTLHELAELDENLTDFEDYVQSKFAAKGLDPEVNNQTEALRKALKGIQAAEQALKQAQVIVGLFPDDKTAPRAVQAAEVMIKRFQRHAETARKIIRRIAKKDMPKDIKKAAASLKRALKRRLVNPKDLQEIPWVEKSWGSIATYQIDLMVDTGTGNLAGVRLEQTLVSPSSGRRDEGVKYVAGRRAWMDSAPGSFKITDAVAGFVEALRGWSGLQGETEATSQRQTIAKEIAKILRRWQPNDSDPVEVSSDGTHVRGGFRGYERWEMHSEWDYDREVPRESAKYKESIRKDLGNLTKHVKSLSVDYSEKGWWGIYINLK